MKWDNYMQTCAGGASENEDAVGCGSDFAFVIDGATGLLGHLGPATVSDAAWFATGVRDKLMLRLPAPEQSAETLLSEILEEMRAEFGPVTTSDPAALPNAGLALVRRVGDDMIEYAGLGGVRFSVRFQNGEFALFQGDSNLTALDQKALQEMEKLVQTGKTFSEALQAIRPILIRNRRKLNQEDGYCALSLTGFRQLKKRTLLKTESLLLYSDGFEQCIDFGIAESPQALHNMIAESENPEQSIGHIMRRLQTLQYQDRNLSCHPRFKVSDDMSAVLIR